MCREARLFAGVDEEGAVNFRAFDTPAQWNRDGVEGTVRFYRMLSEQKQQEFCTRFEDCLIDWLSKQSATPSASKH